MFVPGMIGYVYPAVNDWVGLVGSVCMTSLGCTFPSIMIIKEMRLNEEKKWKIYCVMVWGLVFTTLGYTSGLFTILKMVHVIS